VTSDCNKDLMAQARRNVADLFPQTYHQNAILAGDWDKGIYVKQEVERLLKQPPLAQGEDPDGE
jgi:hypothetical protein